MLVVSKVFNEAFKSDLREVKMRIKINDVTYFDEDIVSFNYISESIAGQSFAIGSTFANSIKLTLCKIVEGLKQLDVVEPEMGIILPDGSTEFVKLGTFLISEQVNPDRNENRTSLECTDRMIMLDDKYESKLKYPAKIRDVALEIANLAGVEVDKPSFSRLMTHPIKEPQGYTFRQALGLIAQFEAGYVCFDRNGLLAIRQLEDKNYQVTPDEYFLKGLTKNELMFRPAGIEVKVSDDTEKVLSVGNKKGSIIHLENKVMTDQLLKLIYEKIKNINFYPYSLKWRGNPAVEVGDWLQVDDTRGNIFKVPNLSYSLEYKGGLTATSTVETSASNEVRMGYKGALNQIIEYVNTSIKDIDGNVTFYGVEEPPYPKEGDIWFKKNGPDTEIWIYEKIGEPDIFDWVFKISTAIDNTIKDKIEDLENISKENTEKVDQALKDAEKARDEAFNSTAIANYAKEQAIKGLEQSNQALIDAEKAREEAEFARKDAFDAKGIASQAEQDALSALALGDGNRTQIESIEGEQKITNSKVEGNTVNLNSLQNDADGMKLSLGKVQSDVENLGNVNLLLVDSKKNSLERTISDPNGHNFICERLYLNEELKEGDNYTLSFDIKRLKGDFDKYTLREFPSGKIISMSYVDDERVVFSSIKTSNFDSILIYAGVMGRTSGNGLSLKKIMINRGSFASDYFPTSFELVKQSEFATFEVNYKGFQQTVSSDITGLQSQRTQMDGQISSVVEKIDNIDSASTNLILDSINIVISPRGFNGGFSRTDNVVVDEWKTDKAKNFKGINSSEKTFGTISNGKKAPNNTVRKGFEYVWSIYIRNNHSVNSLKITNNASSSVVIKPKEAKRVVIKGVGNGIQMLQLNFQTLVVGEEVDFDYFQPMIAEGAIVGAWQPAPEDNASKTKVNQLSDLIALTALEVKTLDTTVTKQQGQIVVLTDQVTQTVTDLESVNGVVVEQQGQLTILSNQINATVKKVDENTVQMSEMKQTQNTMTFWITELDKKNDDNQKRITSLEINLDGFQATVTDNLTGMQGQLTLMSDQMNSTIKKVETVDGKVSRQETRITQLSNQLDFKVSANEVISRINMSPERIRIDSKLIHLSGKTLIDDAVIKTAHIDDLAVTGAKIQDATISSAKIISIVADKIITGTLTGITLTGNTINGGTINNAYFYNTGARGTVRINNGGISALEFWTEDNGAFMSENGYAILRSGGKKSSDHVFLQASTEVRATRVRTFDEYIPIKASSFYAHSSGFQGYNNTTFSTEWGYVTLRSINNAVYLQAKTEVKATKPSDPETYVPVRASSFPSGSLERFKTNIQEYKADALELIDNSTIYTYRLKSEVKDMIDKPRIGLVIGDGYKTPKEVIDGDGVEQYAMNSISWKAIQELHRKIKRLEERLEYENIT